MQKTIIEFLKKNASIFTWTTSDMKGINPIVTSHELKRWSHLQANFTKATEVRTRTIESSQQRGRTSACCWFYHGSKVHGVASQLSRRQEKERQMVRLHWLYRLKQSMPKGQLSTSTHRSSGRINCWKRTPYLHGRFLMIQSDHDAFRRSWKDRLFKRHKDLLLQSHGFWLKERMNDLPTTRQSDVRRRTQQHNGSIHRPNVSQVTSSGRPHCSFASMLQDIKRVRYEAQSGKMHFRHYVGGIPRLHRDLTRDRGEP